jgi:hypothetical protein
MKSKERVFSPVEDLDQQKVKTTVISRTELSEASTGDPTSKNF